MKNLLFILGSFVITITAYSQVHIEAYYREYCYYNDSTESFDDCYGYEENSSFDIAHDWSYWIHTTPKMQSTYYVNDVVFMKEYNVDFYYVESDAGNKYIYVFDELKNEIRIFGVNKDGESFILTFYTNLWE